MDNVLLDILLPGAGVPITIGLVEVIKRTWARLPVRLYPLTAILSGVIWTTAVEAVTKVDANFGTAVLFGVVIGLTASGLYSGTIATVTLPTSETRKSRKS